MSDSENELAPGACPRCVAGEPWGRHHCSACGAADGHRPDCILRHAQAPEERHAWHAEASALMRERDTARAEAARWLGRVAAALRAFPDPRDKRGRCLLCRAPSDEPCYVGCELRALHEALTTDAPAGAATTKAEGG